MTLIDALNAAPPPTDGRVVLAVPDGTRPLDIGAALAVLRDHLPAHTDVIVGLGLHRKMRPDELPATDFRISQHDPDDVTDLGDVSGIPCHVNRTVAEADTVLGMSVVEPHQYAGFSGGHKAVAVGCGGRRTLDALHHRDRVTAPGVDIGRLEGNPFRLAVDQLGAHARCGWVLLQYGPGRWLAGDPVTALREAAALADCWWDLPRLYPAAILTVPPTKAVNFYQASRAATYIGLAAAPPLTSDATLFLDAACPEGIGQGSGEQAFGALLAASPYPWSNLLDGPAPTGAGTQRAVMLALLLRRFPNLVLTGLVDAQPFRALGLQATSTPGRALAPPDALVVERPFDQIPRYQTPG